jgi:drug/metabolite transporter (DMT)-like permease
VFIALHFGLWITSLDYTSIASSVVLVTCHPAFVTVASYLLWRERLNRFTLSGMVIAFLGVIVINYGGLGFGSRAMLGNLLAVIAGLAMGAYLIIGGQLRARIGILSYLTIIYTGSALMLLVATLISGHSLAGYSTNTYLMLVLLALVPQLIGHSCLNLTLRLMPVTLVSVAILGEPVGATLLGCFILGEIPTAREVVGGLLILGGIFLVLRQRQ